MTLSPRHRRWTLILLLGCIAVSLICVAYPIYVIRPFRAQGERELAVALQIMGFRSVVTVISALIAVAGAVVYWRAQPRRWRRILAVCSAGLVCVFAVLARVNVYELMFHPVNRPSFKTASEVKLDKDEMVIAIKIGNQARAYPVRSVSYHHVVNDAVDTKAVVATY